MKENTSEKKHSTTLNLAVATVTLGMTMGIGANNVFALENEKIITDPGNRGPAATLPKWDGGAAFPKIENPAEVERPGAEFPKAQRPVGEFPKVERPGTEFPKAQRPVGEFPKVERPGAEFPKQEPPTYDTHQ